jgi:hypothetical protein
LRRTRLSRRLRVAHTPSLATPSVAQQEIFKDKLAFATGELGNPTGRACYVVASGLWPGFAFDDVILRLAVGTRERNKRRWLPPAIYAPDPQYPILNCETRYITGRRMSRVCRTSPSYSSRPERMLLLGPLVHAGGLFLLLSRLKATTSTQSLYRFKVCTIRTGICCLVSREERETLRICSRG